ncbi:MAG: hypothetical protein GC151_12455 [Betaproteobacteria bacterium]|nr:hypothetical protein [Betaproteobacteria bacterium]
MPRTIMLSAVLLLHATLARAACTPQEMETRLEHAGWVEPCPDRSCTALRGTAVVVSHCEEPAGVRVKLVAWDRNDEKVLVSEYWPFGNRDVAPGPHEFSIDSRIGYDATITRFTIEAVAVREWGR